MKLRITAKCSDMFDASLIDNKGEHVRHYSGYVPSWFPNPSVEHYGDYVDLDIDMETGRILNWKKPSQATLNATFYERKD